jgi:signal transduction histidine kinase
VRHIDTPPLQHIADLGKNDTILVKRSDYAAWQIQERCDSAFGIRYCSPKEGLLAVRNKQSRYFIWGEEPLKRKMQEYHFDSLVLDRIDIPAGELRIIGYDKEIVDIIDDEFTRLEQAGELQSIYDKWFHPERVHDDASPVAIIILVGLVIAGFIAFLLSRLTVSRVKAAVRRNNDLHQMMDKAINMGEFYVIELDLSNYMLYNRYGHLLPFPMNGRDFLKRMAGNQGMQLHNLNESMKAGEIDHCEYQFHVNMGTDEEPHWVDVLGGAMIEREGGKAHHIVYSGRDITRELEEERRNDILGNRYQKIFDTNLIAMSFYDAAGHLLDFNQKMRELCHMDDASEQFFRKMSLFDEPGFLGEYLPGTRESLHVCRAMRFPTLGIDTFIETRIRPIIDDDDRLVYYIVTSRDISAERDMYLEQREHDRKLQAVNEAIKHYEQQLGYLLEECQIFIWSYRPAENVVSLMRTPGETEYTETIEEYIASIQNESREHAMDEVMEAMQQGKAYNTLMLFDRTPVDDTPTWYEVFGFPIFDDKGQLTEYFGISRDVTSLIQAQEQLREERSRAEDSGRMKAAFLANMTHEIRTPLNAIVGFSGLLQTVDTADERHEFIRIIRNNCDMLLRLINDILEASTMGQSLAIEPETVDLAKVFDDICQTLAQRVQEPGVEFQKENPYTTCKAYLDKGRLQQLLTNFVTNAVKYTHEGHIRVGYRKESRAVGGNTSRDGLYFYCEDTGTGIPKEKQEAVFQRFVKLNDYVQGTGLGLSICKAIVEKSGGQIGVTGDVGVGSTFWFWVPIELQEPIQ